MGKTRDLFPFGEEPTHGKPNYTVEVVDVIRDVHKQPLKVIVGIPGVITVSYVLNRKKQLTPLSTEQFCTPPRWAHNALRRRARGIFFKKSAAEQREEHGQKQLFRRKKKSSLKKGKVPTPYKNK